MSNNSLGDIVLESLARLPFESLQEHTVSAVVLALGSNDNADYHLSQARHSLAALGEIKLSTAFKNPDFTATLKQPKPAYTNQGVYLMLKEKMTLGQLQQIFRQLEEQCGRQRSGEIDEIAKQTSVKRVSMDIDILLISLDNKINSLSKSSDYWTIISERYPFKEHEITGIQEIQQTEAMH